MLVLNRKKGESIIIQDNIEISVVGFSGDQVKLSIKAPKEITIYRREIYEQIQKENQEAILNIDLEDFKKLF